MRLLLQYRRTASVRSNSRGSRRAIASAWAIEPERSANVEMPEPGVYSVLLDGRMYDARVEEQPEGLVVVIDGYRFEIEVRDPRRWSRRDAARAGDGVQTVTAPMPGKVVRVLVARAMR